MQLTADTSLDIDRYLARIGLGDAPNDPVADETPSPAQLERLVRAHLSTVPFENLDVVAGIPVRTDLAWSIDKIVERRRGGWCFEVNGAFAALLESLGYDVRLLGCAVLLSGPNRVIDHVAIEVRLDEPLLVDVGFGDGFITPLALNSADPQPGGNDDYQFIASPQGTTLARLEDDVPAAQYRFKRVAHSLADFEPASAALQADHEGHFRTKAFATRLIDGGPDRITVLRDRLVTVIDGERTETPLRASERIDHLRDTMGITPPDLDE